MTRDRWNLIATSFALWLATLFCILVIHYVRPGDPWVAMLAGPSSLVFAPLLVATIPMLAVKPAQETAGEDADEEDHPRTRWVRWTSGTPRKMALIWIVSLVIFGAPHGGTPMAMLDFVWHNPWFLVVAPVSLACVPLFVSPATLRRWRSSVRPVTDDSPYLLWKGLISGVILAVILILCLIGVNSMKGAVGKASVNIALGILLAGDVYVLQKSVRQLRERRRLRDS